MCPGAFAGVLEKVSAWESALCEKISLSERSEFEIFSHAFSRFQGTLFFLGSETAPGHILRPALIKYGLKDKNKKDTN